MLVVKIRVIDIYFEMTNHRMKKAGRFLLFSRHSIKNLGNGELNFDFKTD